MHNKFLFYYCLYNIFGGKNKKKKKIWSTLSHNGVMFDDVYIPHNVPIIYEGKKIILNEKAEQYITLYANKRYDKYRNKKFDNNFWNDWKKLIDSKHSITSLEGCDLSLIKKYLEDEQIKKSGLSKEEKQKIKEENDKKSEKYKYAIIDGVKQEINNFKVEPPSIFIGRGNNPLSGKIKRTVMPNDVTINIGKNEKIPDINIGNQYKWGQIIHDNTLEWIASYINNVTKKITYVRFSRTSSLKMETDKLKFELARKLKKKVKNIRKINTKLLEDENMKMKQLATALYFIDNLALRVGNEVDVSKYSETAGVSTLKVKNVTMYDNNKIKLSFLGKDSIPYNNTFVVSDVVYKNIKLFLQNKNKSDNLFDLIRSSDINNYLKQYMKELTSKIFRTYNSSHLFQKLLKNITKKYENYEKEDKNDMLMHEYVLANLKIAKLCNHQKMVQSDTGEKIKKINDKIKELNNKITKLKDKKGKNKQIENIRKQIKKYKRNREIAKDNYLSLLTSKDNYIDPRITIAFLKKNNMMDLINKIFTKNQQLKFKWSTDVDGDWKF